MEPGRLIWEGGGRTGAPGFHFRAWPHGSRRLTREGGGAQVHRGGAPQSLPQTRSCDPEAVVLAEKLVDGSKEYKGGLGGEGRQRSRPWDAEGWARVKGVTSTRPGTIMTEFPSEKFNPNEP